MARRLIILLICLFCSFLSGCASTPKILEWEPLNASREIGFAETGQVYWRYKGQEKPYQSTKVKIMNLGNNTITVVDAALVGWVLITL